MIRNLIAVSSLALLIGATSVEASPPKHSGGGGPISFTVSCLIGKGKIFKIPSKQTPQVAIAQCLAFGGHPVGVTPNFGLTKK